MNLANSSFPQMQHAALMSQMHLTGMEAPALLHGKAIAAGYIPVIYSQKQQNFPGSESGNIKIDKNWLLSQSEILTLILNAMIFITVFAWIDVLATSYRDRLYNQEFREKLLLNSQIAQQNAKTAGQPIFTFLPNIHAQIHAQAQTQTLHMPHHVPEHIRKITEELNAKSKMGYAFILTGLTIAMFFTFSYINSKSIKEPTVKEPTVPF